MNLTMIILIICPAFCILMFIYFKWYIKKRTSETGVIKETNIKFKNIINDVNLSIAAINEVTDRNLLIVEDKIKKLKEVIEDADKRISVYVKEVKKSKAGEALYTELGRGVRAAVKEPSSAPQLSIVRTPAAPKAEQPMLFQNTAEPASPVKPPSKKQIRLFIDQLAEEGLSSLEIASKLGISVAEVELAMQLRRK